MKRTELQSLINECIGEVLNEGKANKKKLAIKEIKRIIAENELSGADVEEGLGDVFGKVGTAVKKAFTTEPATDAELDKYLSSPQRKAGAKSILKYEPAKLKSWREFVKKNYPKEIRNLGAFPGLRYENNKWVISSGPGDGKSTSFND
jgi:hypothetical protein